ARMMAKPGTTLKHHLRARIERPNHFYVGSWHIESIPEQWNKKDHTYQVKLRFFKRYGEGKHLEEYVGSSMVKGRLVGEKDLYLLQASHKETFNNRDNQPVLVVGIGPVSEKDDRLSKVTGTTPSAR